MIENETLMMLSKNENLKNDYNFSEILASEMNNFYIGKSIKIPENEIIKIIGKSKLDNKITLMPYQLLILKNIEKNNNVVVSAPTSFGKSFLILEFIKRNIGKFSKIAYIVHTKSLKDEIYGKMKDNFEGDFYVTDDIEEVNNYEKIIIVLISDGQNTFEFDIDIDLLIVDEAYNLSKQHSKERHFCIMRTYHKLLETAKKVILLGPYISEITGENSEKYNLIKTDYSPVTQKIIEKEELGNITAYDRFIEQLEMKNKTIAYFGSKTKIYNYIDYLIENYDNEEYVDPFINWMEDFFPDFWLLPKLMKKKVGLYHSSFPKYINLYNMNKFNNGDFMGLITTSAILEGVNTSSKSLVIFDSTAGKDGDASNNLTPFQFFNLCGRVGRLGKEIVGYVYNYGDSYKNKYLEKSMPLYIGNENINDEFDELDIDNECENKIKKQIEDLLNQININYDKWYEENSYYSSGSENMLGLLKQYLLYRIELKEKINDGSLNKKGTNEINKNKMIENFYDEYVSKNEKFKYRPRSKFYINNALQVFLRSEYKGVDFVMKKICNDYCIKRDIENLDITDKNKYVLELMNVGYNYIPYSFYNISYLFNQFVNNDLFWSENEKEILTKNIFDRVLLYVNGDTGIHSKLKKILSNMGVIPPTIEKIVNYVKKENIDVRDITKNETISLLKEIKENIDLEDFEIINFRNMGINV